MQQYSTRIYYTVVCAIQETTSPFLINIFSCSKQVSYLTYYSFKANGTISTHNSLIWKKKSDNTLEHFLTCICDVKIFSQSPSSVATGEFGGSARILRLRVSTTECMPPLRLLIMAHPFPPGSTLQSPSHPPPPSLPLYITIHITIVREGWIPPFCYAQTPDRHTNHGPC